MKSYHINLGAGLDGLVMKEHDIPMPGPRQVLVRVRASSLNYRELMILIKGSYPLPVKPDVVPVSDGAGEVVAVGEGVRSARVGDRVAGSVFAYWIDGPFAWETAAQLGGSLDGMLTEYALLPEKGTQIGGGTTPIQWHGWTHRKLPGRCVSLLRQFTWTHLAGPRTVSAQELG